MSVWIQIAVSNIAVATMIGALAALVGRGGRRAPLAHVLWILVLIKLVTPPLFPVAISVPAEWLPASWLPQPVGETSLAALDTPSVMDGGRPSGQLLTQSPTTGRAGGGTPPANHGAEKSLAESSSRALWPAHLDPARMSLHHWLVFIWGAGASFVVIRGLIRFTRFHRLLLQEATCDPEATAFVQQLLQDAVGPRSFGRGRVVSPKVLRIPARVSPMLFGFGRSAVIVCPDRLWKLLSQAEQQAFLAHEAAHYYRRDHWVRWLEWLVTAVYWWFPGVYIARRELERHEEAACDAWAVEKLASTPRQYAATLLHVVDFLSEHPAGIPRLASGMQPTDSLEQRIRLLMQPSGSPSNGGSLHWSAGAICLAFWAVHPWVHPRASLPAIPQASGGSYSQTKGATTAAAASLTALPLESSLPAAPRGYWNQRPGRRWANLSLTLPGAKLIADASRGIEIVRPLGEPLKFPPAELSSIVEIPSTGRVVIGDEAGGLRLWDLQAGLPTSLIGRHGAAVTSTVYHESLGVISGDAAGSIIRWDIQSGQVLATWSMPVAPVQSIRISEDAKTLAVLMGSWSDSAAEQQVRFVNAATLQPEEVRTVSSTTAVVLCGSTSEWLAVEWSGLVRSLSTGMPLAIIEKHDVSALVLSQNAKCSWTALQQQGRVGQ